MIACKIHEIAVLKYLNIIEVILSLDKYQVANSQRLFL